MPKRLLRLAGGLCALGLAIAPSLACAQNNAIYAETTLSVSAGAWTLAAPANALRRALVISDAVGQGCVWSTIASPAAGQGFVFSLAGTPGAWSFDPPIVANAIYVKCASAAVLTLGQV